MKIVHIIEHFQPELGYQETFLCKEHAKLGHEVYMVTSDRCSNETYKTNKHILINRIKGNGFFKEEGISVYRLRTFELPHFVWLFGLERTIKYIDPDLIIVHTIPNITAIRLAFLKNKQSKFKLIYDDHMVFKASISKLSILYPVFKIFISPLIQRKASAFVAVATTCATFMNKKYGIPLNKITILPLGADNELFHFDDFARQDLRKRYLVDDEVLFVYAGKIIPEKGPHLLIDAATHMKKNNNKFKILLVGRGPKDYLNAMKQRITITNNEQYFIWQDTVPNRELYKIYSAGDVAVWPRQCSLSMLEAMAVGLPVIISDGSEVTERLRWDNGFSFRADDTEDLVRQMEKLLDPVLRKRMGENGRRKVGNEFNWKFIASQFIELVKT